MKTDKELLKTLAQSADIVNTINGGMSLAYVRKTQLPDHYLVTVKVPGVDVDSLRLEMHKGHLFVFQVLHLEGIEIPYLITGIELDEEVDREAVRANFEDNRLNILLPFGPVDSREIDIEHD